MSIEDDVKEAEQMLGKGYDQPTVIIEPPRKVTARHNGRMVEVEEPAWVKFSTDFKAELKTLDEYSLKVFLYIGLSVNWQTGQAFPGTRLIAADTGMNKDTVTKAVENLENLGFLTIQKREGTSNIYTPTRYISIGTVRPERTPTAPEVGDCPTESGDCPTEGGGLSDGSLSNLHNKNNKKNKRNLVDAKASEPAESKPQTPPPPEWGLAWQLAAGVEEVVLPDEDQAAQAKISNAVELFPQAYKELVRAFILATGIFPIKADVGAWCKAFRDQDVRTGLTTEDIAQACKQMFNDKLTIKDPFSVMGVAGNIHNDLKRKVVAAENKQPNVVDTPFAQALEDKTPRSPEFQKSLEDFGKVLRERNAAKKRQTA